MLATQERTVTQRNGSSESISVIFQKQKEAYAKQPFPTLNDRKDALLKLKRALLKNQTLLVKALSEDFGYRSEHDSIISDILPVVRQINYTLSHLKQWMKPSRRHAGLLLAPAKVRVEYQPKGVVGIIAPWNFPIMLALSPLVTSLAAGNRTMIKVSEFTPATNKVLIELLKTEFACEEIAVIEGEADVANAFSQLPFDHILFTGSTSVGKLVMRAASENLTPVTLELGGKSPVIIADDMPIDTAVERLIYGKCLNAGQICVAPDYVLCPEDKIDSFVKAYQRHFQKCYPNFQTNSDYSQIINLKQAERLKEALTDAVEKGAIIHAADTSPVANQQAPFKSAPMPVVEDRKWATQLVTQVTDDMTIMQQEIFGPLLPVLSYKTLEQAIDRVNKNPRPLALYLMTYDQNMQKQVLKHTHSGGVCINETLLHVAAEDAPFGGIGHSGMGHYHGVEGFRTFSHAKTVLQRGRITTGKLIHPPYRKWFQLMLIKFFLR